MFPRIYPVFAIQVCVSVSLSRSGPSVCVRPCQAAEIDSMGGCALSQASVTGLATSAAGQPSAPIVSEAQHSPARMAGLVKDRPFPLCPPPSLTVWGKMTS